MDLTPYKHDGNYIIKYLKLVTILDMYDGLEEEGLYNLIDKDDLDKTLKNILDFYEINKNNKYYIEGCYYIFEYIKKYYQYYTNEKIFELNEIDNVYLEIFNKLDDREIIFSQRDLLVRIYSWAIPDENVLNEIINFSPKILEIGAGTGYWAYLLKNRGCDIIATDKNPKNTWIDVIKENYIDAVKKYDDRTLMICWSALNDTKLFEENIYKQKKLIYIGEYDGCTGWLIPYLEEHNLIKNKKIIEMPKYKRIHDKCYLINLN